MIVLNFCLGDLLSEELLRRVCIMWHFIMAMMAKFLTNLVAHHTMGQVIIKVKKKKETSVNTLLFGGFIRSSIADDFPKLTVDKLEDAIYKSIKELAAKKQRLIFLTFKFSLLPYFLRNLLTKAKCLSKMRKICSFAVRFSFFS